MGTSRRMSAREMAARIDHTLLRPEATPAMIEGLCREAQTCGFWSVCVAPVFVAQARRLLSAAEVRVCTVIGFPLGANRTAVKVAETRLAIADGADEIDMVLNIGALNAEDHDRVSDDIGAVVAAAGERIVKVILETCLLDDSQVRTACRLVVAAGAGFVKTSTGFSHAGADVETVRLMRQTVGPEFGVKASGGIRDYAGAGAMLDAGANRLGTSSGVAILSKLGPAGGDC